MSMLSRILLALGLAMDAFAVSISCGISDKQARYRTAMKCGVTFGFFQAAMTAIGFLLASTLANFIEPVDHWVAFGLLSFVGGKMLYEAASGCQAIKLSSTKMLLTLAVATSIDAMAAGIGLAAIKTPMVLTIVLIGVITAVLSYVGVLFGARMGQCKYGKYFDIAGGLILIGLGIKTLIEHLM